MGVIGRAAGNFSGVLDMPAVMEGSASVRRAVPVCFLQFGGCVLFFDVQCLATVCGLCLCQRQRQRIMRGSHAQCVS